MFNMNLNHEISQRLEQKLGLSIKAQQALKILQLNSMELNTELSGLIEANPLLELERDDYELAGEAEGPIEDDYDPESGYSIYMKNDSFDREGWDFERLEAPEEPFSRILEDFSYYVLDDEEYELFKFLIQEMNELGLLDKPIVEIEKENRLEPEALRNIVEKLRNFGFDGIFAENVEELKSLNIERAFPASGFEDGRPVFYIEPDMYIELIDNKFVVNVRNYGLVINVRDCYQELLVKGDEATIKYLNSKLEEATFYVSALERRRNTLLTIGNEIVLLNASFLSGVTKTLNPLKMSSVADILGVGVSTISRAVKGKFALTPAGTFPLRYFFGNVHEKNQAMEIMVELLKDDPGLSDSKIAEILKERGVSLARRTVNKYRNILGLGKE